MTSIDPVPGHGVDYQNLGGDAYEIVVGGQATQGTVIPVGETDWVAISRRGTVLGYHLSKEGAAAVVVNEWEARRRSQSLGTSRQRRR